MPGLLGAPALLGFNCLLNEPGLLWSDGWFFNPGLLGMPGLLGVPDLLGVVCLKEMFCLLFCLRESSLLIGAPTSSGVFKLLLFFALILFVFWSGLLDSLFMSPELKLFLEDSLDLTLLLIFLGFAINWIGGFAGLLIGGIVLFRKFLLSWLKFCESLPFVFWFVIFGCDGELLIIFGLLRFLDWFEIFFKVSGLFIGFINNGLFFELSLRGSPFKEEATVDLSALFCL